MKEKSRFVEGILSTGMALEEGLQVSARVVEEERVSCGGRCSNEQC